MRLSILLALVVATYPAAGIAAERSYSVTDFDRMRVEGNYQVVVETGRSPSARAIGTTEGIDRVTVRVDGRMLVIRRNLSAWGGNPARANAPVIIRLTVPGLRAASINGSGSLSITEMKSQRVSLTVIGAGSLSVGRIATDNLDAGMTGAGKLTMGGRAAKALIIGRGSGELEAPDLVTSDLILTWESAGNARAFALKTAKVTSSGAGVVTVSGKPACTVQSLGVGEVVCGD